MIRSCDTRADFDRLRQEGVRRSGSSLWIRHVRDIDCSPPRVAFALGRRNGSAPRRNRLRRQLRAMLNQGGVDLGPGIYLIGHSGPIVPKRAPEIRRDLEHVLARLAVTR